MEMRRKVFALLLVGTLLGTACGGAASGPTATAPRANPTAPTEVAVVQETKPAETPEPAATIEPTSTPTPPPPTPTPMPTPTMTAAQIKDLYRGDVDPRELYKNIDKYLDWKLRFEGTVLSIYSDGDGTLVQLKVPYGSGILETKVIDLIYPASVNTDGIFEDSNIAVWGRPLKMFTITNGYGGQVDQPLLAGDYIEPRG